MREQRLVFGEVPGLYDKARPSYPPALIDQLVAMVGSNARVLDVGCGTAKAAVLLAARGLSGLGVEADPSMAAQAMQNLSGYPKWRVEVSDFEAWEPGDEDRAFDLVCAAQAWHWLNPEIRLHKAHRLLRRGGWLALWWNRPDEQDSSLAAALTEVYDRQEPEMAINGYGSKGAPRLDPIPAGLSFSEPELHSYKWDRDYTPEQWADLLRTQSNHRLLPPERLDSLLSQIEGVIRAHGGVYRHPYVCWLWTMQKE
jgi:SAM-dependent methyltransferase